MTNKEFSQHLNSESVVLNKTRDKHGMARLPVKLTTLNLKDEIKKNFYRPSTWVPKLEKPPNLLFHPLDPWSALKQPLAGWIKVEIWRLLMHCLEAVRWEQTPKIIWELWFGRSTKTMRTIIWRPLLEML